MSGNIDISPGAVEEHIQNELKEFIYSKGMPISNEDIEVIRSTANILRSLSSALVKAEAESKALRERLGEDAEPSSEATMKP